VLRPLLHQALLAAQQPPGGFLLWMVVAVQLVLRAAPLASAPSPFSAGAEWWYDDQVGQFGKFANSFKEAVTAGWAN
jgi:hypothetical protein